MKLWHVPLPVKAGESLRDYVKKSYGNWESPLASASLTVYNIAQGKGNVWLPTRQEGIPVTDIEFATVAQVRKNFEKYLISVQDNGEIVITKGGKPVARLIAYDKDVSFLVDSLVGVLKHDYGDGKSITAMRIAEHEGIRWPEGRNL